MCPARPRADGAASDDLSRSSMTDDHHYLLIDEAAEFLRSSVGTLRHWRQTGTGPACRRVGNRLLYRREDLIDWVEAHAPGGSRAGLS